MHKGRLLSALCISSCVVVTVVLVLCGKEAGNVGTASLWVGGVLPRFNTTWLIGVSLPVYQVASKYWLAMLFGR